MVIYKYNNLYREMNVIDFYKRNEFINRKNLLPTSPIGCTRVKLQYKR